jgi:alkanesulfonate monooxygenase SsuD/methylene tetrahydromethanopterin reductase-like flavin-dependent oxidoreductase (luciferase family)
MAPPPIQRPHPPLFIGGRADPSLRRVARHGDAFFPYFQSPDGYAARLATVQQYALEYGRDPAAIQAVHQLHIYAGSSREQALETAAASLLESYSLGWDAKAVLDKFCAYGTPADCAERIRQFVAVGVRHFVFELLCPAEESLRQCEVLAHEVLPLV